MVVWVRVSDPDRPSNARLRPSPALADRRISHHGCRVPHFSRPLREVGPLTLPYDETTASTRAFPPPPRPCQAKISRTPLTHSPQSKFSSRQCRRSLLNLAKIDISVFTNTTSRVVRLATTGNNPIQNLPRKSLFHKILPVSPWRSRFYPGQVISNQRNRNKINILAPTDKKNFTDIYPYPTRPPLRQHPAS
jgi:hypothetical protein